MSGGKLPEGWVDSSLGDVLDVNSGVGFPIKFQGKNSGDYPVYKVSDISLAVTKNKGNLSTAGHYISKEEAIEIKGKIFRLGSTAFAKIGEAVKLNRRAIVQSPGLADNNVMVISAVLHEMDKFIFHFMNTIDLSEQARSTTVPSIRKGDIENIRLALPSIYEQKIIVEKLDTLLAQIDSTKARLEQIPQILKRFRQAVLASALKGELTSKWRIANKTGQDISSFKDSVKKYRFENWVKEQEQKFSNKGKQPKNDSWKKKYQEAIISQDITGKEIPDGWLFEPLDGLVYISARIGWKGLKASEYTVKGPLFLSVHSLNYGKEVNLVQAYHISERRYNESPEIMLKNDDILLCKDGAGIGKLAIVKNLNEPATINSSLLLIRAGDFFIPEYLFYFLSGPDMQNLVKERMTGSAVPHLFQRDVKEFVLEVPPLKEQHEIVRRVEQLFAYADTIEKQVNSALTRVNSLTQSILAKAFRGELTAQWRAENPDLISGENSAAALLEKIKAERAASGGKKTSRKKA